MIWTLRCLVAFMSMLMCLPGWALDRSRFFEKHQQGCPQWMREQIEEDFSEFFKTGITEKALQYTLKQCIHTGGGSSKFTRYRIINNQIFRSNHEIWLNYFDGVLLELTKLVHLPDVDFILCLHDGVVASDEQRPVCLEDNLYWVTQDRSNQAPVFARARQKKLPYIALLPDYSAYSFLQTLIPIIEQASLKYPWEKKERKAFWRGFASERPVIPDPTLYPFYKIRPRLALCIQSFLFPNLVDAGMVEPVPSLEEHAPFWSHRMTQAELEKGYLPMAEQLSYAYLPCLDGIVCSYPGYYYRLLSNSVTFHAESADELWFYRLLRPYEHYIPLKSDCSDIVEAVLWAQEHDDQCREIAERSRELVRNSLSEEDNYLYVLYALQRYARLQKFVLEPLWKETIIDPDWRQVH